jgi:hypothetical protein
LTYKGYRQQPVSVGAKSLQSMWCGMMRKEVLLGMICNKGARIVAQLAQHQHRLTEMFNANLWLQVWQMWNHNRVWAWVWWRQRAKLLSNNNE